MINVSEILFNIVKDEIDEKSIIDFDLKLRYTDNFRPGYLITFHFLDSETKQRSKKEFPYSFSAEITQDLRIQDVNDETEFINYYKRISNLNKLTL